MSANDMANIQAALDALAHTINQQYQTVNCRLSNIDDRVALVEQRSQSDFESDTTSESTSRRRNAPPPTDPSIATGNATTFDDDFARVLGTPLRREFGARLTDDGVTDGVTEHTTTRTDTEETLPPRTTGLPRPLDLSHLSVQDLQGTQSMGQLPSVVSPIFHAIEASRKSSLLRTGRPDVAGILAMHLVSPDPDLRKSGRPPGSQPLPVGYPPLVTPSAGGDSLDNVPPMHTDTERQRSDTRRPSHRSDVSGRGGRSTGHSSARIGRGFGRGFGRGASGRHSTPQRFIFGAPAAAEDSSDGPLHVPASDTQDSGHPPVTDPDLTQPSDQDTFPIGDNSPPPPAIPGAVPYTYTPTHVLGGPSQGSPYKPRSGVRTKGVVRGIRGWSHSSHETGTDLINWFAFSDKGPYGGTAKHIKSYGTPLQDDSFTEFFRWYNGIRTQLATAQYHLRLLPPLDCINPLVDLTRSPVDAAVMPILPPPSTASITWEQQAYWDNEHTTLGMILYTMMTGKDALAAPAKRTLQVIQSASRHGNGFLVLQILLRRHHPRVSQSVAPTYSAALLLRPVMGGDGEFHVDYFHRFSRWNEQLQLYHEYGVAHKQSEYVIWFIEGLAKAYRFHMQNFEHSLRHFRTFNMHHSPEPPLPHDLTVEELSHQLTVFVPEHNSFSGRKRETLSGASVASVATGLDFLGDYDGEFGISDGHDVNVLALQRRRAYGSSLPSAPCQYAPCRGRSHPPDLCCICNQPHPVERCWHVKGLLDDKNSRVKEFQALVASGDIGKTESGRPQHPSTSGRASTAVGKPGAGQPRVSFIQSDEKLPLPPDSSSDDPPPIRAPLDDDVRDVQEMMLLQEQPFNVPVLPSSSAITYPHFAASINVASLSSTSSSGVDSADGPPGPPPPPDDFAPAPAFTDNMAHGLEPTIAPPPGHTWWHVDTGANSFVTPYGDDCYQLVPTRS